MGKTKIKKSRISVARAVEILKQRHYERTHPQQMQDAEDWYPTANDLALPDVPWDVREDVREALKFLGPIPIQAKNESWLIAQAIAQLGDPQVEYVEGLMSAVGEKKVTPGAWNVVNGHIVSLFTEFKNRTESKVWMYEPLKTYPLAMILAARKAGHPTCSYHEWAEANPGQQPDQNLMERVFKAPFQRMYDRKCKDHEYIEVNWN
jgi:hypothetical protein